MGKKENKDTLLLIDANSLIHRAFHALPPLTGPEGKPSGALYGLTSILIKIFKERSPQYAAAAFDRPEPTFRDKEYADYKATRPPTPDALVDQIKEARNLLEKFGLTVVEKAGFEADDLIATLADKLNKEVSVVEILSGDLDILQAVNGDKIVADVPKRGISETKLYNQEAVKERFCISPDQMADYKGLVGDTSDNIPGVPGIGPKTAQNLLNEYKSLDDIYKNLDKISKEKESLGEKLKEHKDQAFLSRKLAKLEKDVPIKLKLSDLKVEDPLRDEKLFAYMESLGFKTLLGRIKEEPKKEANTLF